MRARVGWIVVIAGVLAPLHIQAQNQTLVLEGGTLIDGTGRAPINDAVIVIEGSRIKAVGAKGQVSHPASARVIRTDGRTILPGLVDAHVHLRDYMPPMFLRYGVTTVADTHDPTEWSLAQRDAINSGRIKGPRTFVSGERAANTREGNPPSIPLQTVDEARAYVKKLIAMGVDVIKVDLSLSYDQLRAVIEEATAAGLSVVGHSQNIRKAAEVGLKYMEHTDTLTMAVLDAMGRTARATRDQRGADIALMDTTLFPPLIAFMVKQGVYVNPTLAAQWRSSTARGAEWAAAAAKIVQDPGLAFVPADVRQSWTQPDSREPNREGYAKMAEFVRKYAEAGGKVVSATDAGFMPGLSMHYEMQMVADIGVPPMKVIQGATLWAAESFGKAKDLGSVEAGKLADLIVIDGNPLNDIAATKNIRMVIKDGQVLDTTYDPRFVNPLPRPVDVAPQPR
jgi:imidazolonepropionase-like amidohydrolase